MKKIFSSVLMAVALLVSAHMQAGNVARIGDTEYATLQAAFNAAQDEDVIELIDNIAIGSTVTINKADQEITLDLAGKSWNFNDGTNSLALGLDLQAGDLIITGFGGMKDSVASATFVRTAAGTSLVIENGNFTNKGAAAGVDCKGDVEIEGAWVNYVKVDGGNASFNGTHVNTQILLANAAEAIVYGGSIEKIAGNGTLTVKAGTITTIENAGTNLCEGGTVTTIAGGTNTIEGGKFTALNATGATYTLKGGLFASNTFVGGAALSTAVAQGYSVKANAGSFASSYPYQVSKDLVKIVETNVIYGTIGEALSAAKNNETVQLLADVILGGNLNVYLAGKVTLDLNGKSWKLDDGHSYQQTGMRVYTGELVVTGNGSIVYSGENGSCTFFDMKKDTKLNIENGTFSTGCITCDGELTINGGTMKAVTLGNNAPALTVNGGTITSQLSLASYPVAQVEVVINSGTIENICTMNDKIHGTYVTVNGGHITWLQNTDSTFINDGIIDNINGGWCVIKKVQNKVIYFENDSSKSPYYRVSSFIMSGGIYSNVEYVCDEGKHSLDVAPGYGVFPNEDEATKTIYPFEIRKAVDDTTKVVDPKAKAIAEQIPSIATESGIEEAVEGYDDKSNVKFLVVTLEEAVVNVDTVKSITYDVKPKITYTDNTGVHTEIIPNDKINAPITFRLTVDAWFANRAVRVYHKGATDPDFELFGYYTVQEENGKYFVELESDNFSLFKVQDALDQYKRTIDAERWGTICYPYQILQISGAELYEPSDKTDTELAVDPVELKDVVAGKAYIFYAENANPIFYYDGTSTAATSAEDNNGLIGNMTASTITLQAQKWVITNNVVKPAAIGTTVGEYRAYIDLTLVNPTSAPARAGRKIFKIANTPTELVEMQNAQCTMQNGKVMINGQLIIMKDGKMFNAQGMEL